MSEKKTHLVDRLTLGAVTADTDDPGSQVSHSIPSTSSTRKKIGSHSFVNL